ncbi:MAG: prepilin-type N-terminal cleavage/methylation domain-containing protein [Fuerstiella sp.]|nr:prepilin-type N-terminal cleavage/methylation domain-containing protein [Fuerstiella sp.]
MRNRTNPIQRPRFRGFTLIELVLVLVILAVLATAALNMVDVQVDQTRFETTQQSVESVRDAILSERNTGAGQVLLSGFYPDMGRLPVAYPESLSTLSARELWDNSPTTTNLATFRNVQAATVNVVNPKSADGQDVYGDSTVTLGMGWQGPYLNMPVGAASLTDGWGTNLVSDAGGYSHLRTLDVNDADGDSNKDEELDVTVAGVSIFGVRSLGRDNAADGMDYDSDLPAIIQNSVLDFENQLGLKESQLSGSVAGKVYVDKDIEGIATTALGKTIVQLYYPNPTMAGQFSVQRATLSVNATIHSTHHVFDFVFDDGSGGDFEFPVGTRVIRAYYDDGPDSTNDFGDENGTDPAKVSLPMTFQLYSRNPPLELTINN